VLYQPAFTVISRWYGPARVRPLTILTLVAGFASTIFAPLTAALCNAMGWRGAFLVLAGLLGAITVPLHARYLNRSWQQVSRGAQLIEDRARVRGIRRSPGFVGLQALMVLLRLGLYTVTLNIIPLLMEKGVDYTSAALGLGLVGAGQVAGRLVFAAIPANRRIAVVTGTATVALLLLALLPGPAPLLIGAGMIAGAVRGCQTLLQATIVADRWGTTSLGTLQGTFAAPLTVVTALAPAAGPALATWFGSYAAMALVMALITGAALLITASGGVRGFHAG
jgi:predicted MFS family arabinose efflux permease